MAKVTASEIAHDPTSAKNRATGRRASGRRVTGRRAEKRAPPSAAFTQRR